MEIRDYLDLLERRKWMILVAICVTVAIVAAGSLLLTPVYAATATVRVATAIDKTMNYSDATYVVRLLNTYSKIVTSKPVLEEMKSKFGLAKPLEPSEVRATPVPDTELISITVENPNPALARDIANALADALVARGKGLYTGDTKSAAEILSKQLTQVQAELDQTRSEYEKVLQRGPANTDQANTIYQAITVKQQTYNNILSLYEDARVAEALRANAITITEPATLPIEPSVPNLRMNLLISLAVGVMAGIGLVFLFNSLDTTLYTITQIRSATGMSILGQIPHARRQARFLGNNHPQAEAFRRLRINLSMLDHAAPIHTLLVTSAEAGEGKTTIAANLAYAMAQFKQKILIVDCELRLPMLHKIFDLSNELGLSSILKQEATLSEAIHDSNLPGLWILTSGPLPANPSELINSPEMVTLIKQAAEQFDTVILDTPALLAVKHGVTLASVVDSVLLVVARARARQSVVATACELLVNAKARSIGVVVNHAEMDNTENPA
jgi:capsular exopolysaccharide synthesis family protein